MGSEKEESEFSEILRYHIVGHEFKFDDLFDGMTLRTELKLRSLNGQPQRIRVFEFEGDYLLVCVLFRDGSLFILVEHVRSYY